MHDLLRAKKIKKLDLPCVYNKLLAKAVIRIEQRDYEYAKRLLEQAKGKFKDNRDPYIVQGLSIIKQTEEAYPNSFIDSSR